MSSLAVDTVPTDDALDPLLREQLLATWVAATDAGGSVGFLPPADPAAVGAELDTTLDRVATGADVLVVLRDGDGTAIGMGVLVARDSPLFSHWRTVKRLMVHPDHQGGGAGTALVAGLHQVAADLGLEQLALSVRGGEGLERFYGRLGYEVVGRHPRAVRLSATDLRDEVLLVARVGASRAVTQPRGPSA